MERVRFTTDRGDSGRRLDQALVRRVHDVSRMSRSQAQSWIESGCVTVDGVVARRPSVRLKEGVEVEIAIPESAARRTPVAAEPIPLSIVYEDEWLLALNKPAGLVVHPSYKNVSGTLLNAILGHVRARASADDVRHVPGIVTRLDKDTSGLVVAALTPHVHMTLQRDAAAGHVKKEYLAIVCGAPKATSGTIRLPLARDPDDRRRMVATAGGAVSETRFQVAASDGEFSLLRCELVTGRTHQIRVHLAACGWPVAGDKVYGRSHDRLQRQALHAWRLSLPHPMTRTRLDFSAPAPADLRSAFPSLASAFDL
jgi:23S rRNA pseudouridine1911/1915/1917 synthase